MSETEDTKHVCEFMDLMNNESMIESVQAKLGIRGYFLEHVLKHNLVSDKLKEQVRSFFDESVKRDVERSKNVSL